MKKLLLVLFLLLLLLLHSLTNFQSVIREDKKVLPILVLGLLELFSSNLKPSQYMLS